MKHRHDVAWVRLFGRERPGDWTDRTPHAARRTPHPGTRLPSAPHPGPVGLTSPAVPAPAAAPSHVDVAATSLGCAG